jgi:hypothetical protein
MVMLVFSAGGRGLGRGGLARLGRAEAQAGANGDKRQERYADHRRFPKRRYARPILNSQALLSTGDRRIA